MKAFRTNNLILIVVSLGSICQAATQIQLYANLKNQLTYQLNHSDFLSDKAKKNLKSGLVTRVVLVTKLVSMNGEVQKEQILTLESKYDLWDEKFKLVRADGTVDVLPQDRVEEAFESPGPFSWFSISSLKKDTAYKLIVQETLNPIDKSKFESLQKWVIQQRASLNGLRNGTDTSVTEVSPETAFSSLFYQVWKKSSEGDLLAGETTRLAESEVFTAQSLLANDGVKK